MINRGLMVAIGIISVPKSIPRKILLFLGGTLLELLSMRMSLKKKTLCLFISIMLIKKMGKGFISAQGKNLEKKDGSRTR
jgi:hypothetical protein